MFVKKKSQDQYLQLIKEDDSYVLGVAMYLENTSQIKLIIFVEFEIYSIIFRVSRCSMFQFIIRNLIFKFFFCA